MLAQLIGIFGIKAIYYNSMKYQKHFHIPFSNNFIFLIVASWLANWLTQTKHNHDSKHAVFRNSELQYNTSNEHSTRNTIIFLAIRFKLHRFFFFLDCSSNYVTMESETNFDRLGQMQLYRAFNAFESRKKRRKNDKIFEFDWNSIDFIKFWTKSHPLYGSIHQITRKKHL